MEFIRKAEEVALSCDYNLIELCWMTWLIQPEGKIMRMEKYSSLLSKIKIRHLGYSLSSYFYIAKKPLIIIGL